LTIVASHSLVAAAAVVAGYENVIKIWWLTIMRNGLQSCPEPSISFRDPPTITITSKWAFHHLNCNLQDIGFPRNLWMILPQCANGVSNDGSMANRCTCWFLSEVPVPNDPFSANSWWP
jgi:hypothetical protein